MSLDSTLEAVPLPTADDFLKPTEVAERLRVSPQTVKEWLRTGKLRGLKLAGSMWRISREDFRSFLDAGLGASASPDTFTTSEASA